MNCDSFKSLGICFALMAVCPALAQDASESAQIQAPDQPESQEIHKGKGPGFGQGMRRGQGRGFGRGMGRGFGRGMGQGNGQTTDESHHGHDSRHDADHEVFQFLLQNHKKIKRTVKELPDGVETLTESSDNEVAEQIKDHVEWMEYRIKNTNPIRMRDPLFAELFQHTDKIRMVHEDTENGVRVTETSDDPYVAGLIKAHAKVVSGFVERGFAEAMKNHAVPGKPTVDLRKTKTPIISGIGQVVQLSNAAQQPRPGTKIVIDLTRGGESNEVNAGLKNVAKYLNIFAAGGAEPADVQLAVVFHGDATLAILNPDAYGKKYHLKGNPNLDLLRQLHDADVELYVCGQSLLSKGAQPEDVAVFIETAVSAVTTIANLQADGYSYLPLGN